MLASAAELVEPLRNADIHWHHACVMSRFAHATAQISSSGCSNYVGYHVYYIVSDIVQYIAVLISCIYVCMP